MPATDTFSLASLFGETPAAGVSAADAPGALTERERLRIRLRRRPMLVDGAMGTLLFSHGIPQRTCLDELVLTRPDVVGTIHREYIEAGADAIETNTFGANRFRLAEYGLEKLAGQLSRRGAQLAREARETAGKEVLIAGSVGPLVPSVRMPPPHPGIARAAFREQIEGLLEGGVDLFIIETCDRLEPLLLALEEVRRACDLPAFAQMTFGEELVGYDGTTPEVAADLLTRAGADAVGVNCGAGPLVCLEALVRTGPPSGATARSILPNAVPATAPRPENSESDPAAAAAPRLPRPEVAGGDNATPPTELARKLAGGEFVVGVEIDPPRSIRIERTLEAAALLQAAGVDFVNVSDSATGRIRMGAMAVALGIRQRLDLECIVHLTTRDRNLMALEAELLGAHALGLRNILALTGDPPRVADRPTATAVWDTDAIGLIEIIGRLNRGEDESGVSIGQAAGFTIACALDSTSPDQDKEWSRLERKIAAGAHVIMTQPLYSAAQVESMLDRARRMFGSGGFPVPVLLGVLPLHSARHAEFLHNEVPGITIPDEQRAAMHAAGDRGGEVGLEMAMNLLNESRGHVGGAYIMPSFGRYELAAELVRRLKSRLAAEFDA